MQSFACSSTNPRGPQGLRLAPWDRPHVPDLLLTENVLGRNYSYQVAGMPNAVKKTISLPPDLSKEAEEMAREQGKTLSAVIQDALREVRSRRLKKELRALQGFWSRKARAKGILSERDLERYLTS